MAKKKDEKGPSKMAMVREAIGELGADAKPAAIGEWVTGIKRAEGFACTPDDYRAAKHRVYGGANPERMDLPFWRAMVAGGASAYHARKHFDEDRIDGGAVWCYQRFGRSFTELPDGRVVEIGGEHEDFYDPDFCIYNDVVVHRGDGEFDIYGYPKEVFPPTDFHSATLVGGAIYVIGNVGYRGERDCVERPHHPVAHRERHQDAAAHQVSQVPPLPRAEREHDGVPEQPVPGAGGGVRG